VAAVDRCWRKYALAAKKPRVVIAHQEAPRRRINHHQKMLKQDSARLFVFDLAHIRASASRSGAFPQTLRYESKFPKYGDTRRFL
jgi:hypothetical protein